MIDDRARLIAAFVFTDVVGAWLWMSYRSRRPTGGDEDVPRPRVGLHDDPSRWLASTANPAERPPRRTSPLDAPPLR
jgi:hypothetical protein